jgi:RHS repeat-associated protein
MPLTRQGRRRWQVRLALLAAVAVGSSLLAAPAQASVGLVTVTLTGPSSTLMGQGTAFAGTVTAAGHGLSGESVKTYVDGALASTQTTNSSGGFSPYLTVTTEGSHTVQSFWHKGDALEERSPLLTLQATLPPPPNPTATVSTDIASSSTFIYQGTFAAQQGMDPATIVPERTAVLHGLVQTPTPQPLGGVAVTVVGHPEYGASTSRLDGSIDLVVNGGQPLTLTYRKSGYVSVDRTVEPTWRDYTSLPDVVLTPLDSAVQTITSGSGSMQIAQGTPVTEAGLPDRQATLLVPADTHATMTLPDGSEQYLPSLNVRATEVTVGPNGPKAMPGELPPTSGYTYAVDYTVDEALAANASTVTFDRPLAAYTTNFLDFPVGTPVPAGYYDRSQHTWIASADGIVLKIVGATGGKADVDVTGDGTADTGSGLTDLGITDEERTRLASLYTVGDSMWRVPVGHFTPWDYNWPYGLPAGATPPGQRGYGVPDCTCTAQGSIIGTGKQTVGEVVPIVGTGLALRYDTSRVPGFAAGRTINIGLTGATVPNQLRGVTLDVTVAGTRFHRTFTSAANQRFDYTWDGRDAYGRVLQGAQTATIAIGYSYQAVYYAPAPTTASSGGIGERVTFQSSFLQAGGAALTVNRAGMLITIPQTYTQQVGGLMSAALGDLGGWALTGHHAYDPDSRTLYLGDGSTRTATQLYSGLDTIAGTGTAGTITASATYGDGGAATAARLGKVTGLASAADGTIYLADSNNGVIRKITPTGVISTFAGGASPGAGNGDGGPATSATLAAPVAVAITPDGSVLVADSGANRIRKINSAGIISTFAGGGQPADGIGDGGPATDGALDNPQGVAVGPDGTVYIADTNHNRIRRITPDGRILTAAGGGTPASGIGDDLPGPQAALALPLAVTVDRTGQVFIADTNHDRIRKLTLDGLISTIAGTGIYGNTGDGGPALEATLPDPSGLAIDPNDGTLLIAQPLSHTVRQLDSHGIISTIAGTGIGGFSGEQAVPTTAKFNRPSAVALMPNGQLLIADTFNYRIRRLGLSLPGFGRTDFYVPSTDGSEVYQFNSAGRHLRTLDAVTGLVNASFGYTVTGQLATITDRFSNQVTINRDSNGLPTSIDSPYGQRTLLHLTGDGYLDEITNSAAEKVIATYDPSGGLMRTFIDARHNTSTFDYDPQGRLVSDTGPDLHATTLARTVSDTGTTVTATSAEGHTTSYFTGVTFGSQPAFGGATVTGQPTQAVTVPDGSVTRTVTGLDGSVVSTSPDGSVRTTAPPTGDPRFGLSVMLAGSAAERTPAGITSTTGETRTATLTDPNNPLTLTAMSTTITANGRTFTSSYTAATRTATATSPSGVVETVVYNSDGLVSSRQHGTLAATNYTYDTRGRMLTSTVGSGGGARTTSYTYGTDGLLRTVTNPLNQTMTYTRDLVGRVTDSQLPDGSHVAAGFDPNGNLTSLTPPGQPAHTFGYTSGNQVNTDTPPAVDSNDPTTATSYNRDRQPDTVTLPGGAVVTFGYDTAGRLATTHTAAGDITLGYDAGSGALASIAAPGASMLRYGYDGNLISTVTTDAPVNRTVSYSYGAGQLLSSRAIGGGATFNFGYDTDGQINSVGALSYTRDSNGLPSTSTIGASAGRVATSVTADTFGALEHATASTGTSPSTGVYDAAYTRDKLGRITGLVENVNGVSRTLGYGYDNRGRLTTVTLAGVTVETYTYDANGNGLSVTTPGGTVSASYDAQDRLLSHGTSSYTYNARGDLATKTDPNGTTSYTYDELGHLTHVLLPDARTLDYTYDGLGHRTSRAVNGAVTQRWLYGTGDQPVATLDGNGAVLASYAYGRNGVTPDLIVAGGVTYRVIADGLGTPRLVINTSTGAIVQALTFSSFGQTITDSNPGFQPFGFTGGLSDADTGLVHLGARDYDPNVGRFTTRDPAGVAGSGANLYTYVGSDPVNLIDPTGLDGFPPTPANYVPLPQLIKALMSGQISAAEYERGLCEFEKMQRKIEIFSQYQEEQNAIDRENASRYEFAGGICVSAAVYIAHASMCLVGGTDGRLAITRSGGVGTPATGGSVTLMTSSSGNVCNQAGPFANAQGGFFGGAAGASYGYIPDGPDVVNTYGGVGTSGVSVSGTDTRVNVLFGGGCP